jgi:hypothetical protein
MMLIYDHVPPVKYSCCPPFLFYGENKTQMKYFDNRADLYKNGEAIYIFFLRQAPDLSHRINP